MSQLELKTEDASSSLEESGATGDILSKDRVEFLNRIGPTIAQQMTEALQKLTAEEIKVEFGGVQAFEEGKVFVDVGEKCFGSFVNFSCSEAELEGVVVIFFPLSSAEVLTKLLLKRYLDKLGEEKTDSKMKLSAFKEAIHILLAGYITAIANTLGVKFQISVPKFVRFRNVELAKSALLGRFSNSYSLVSVGQFNISSCKSRTCGGGACSLKGRVLIAY